MQENNIYCGNCVDVMKKMSDSCIDLTVTSPPYDNLRDYKGYDFDFENIAKQLYRITKEGGVVVWVVGDATIKGSETGTSFKQALYFKEIGFRLLDTMIWSKDNFTVPFPNRYHQTFEYMFILTKGNHKTFNPISDRKNKHAGKTVVSHVRESDGTTSKRKPKLIKEHGKRFNVWNIHPFKGTLRKEHPAIFPEQLAHDHILSWSNEGDTVLDPMCGSGTTLKMAKKLGRNYIGIDCSEEYYKIAKERINATT